MDYLFQDLLLHYVEEGGLSSQERAHNESVMREVLEALKDAITQPERVAGAMKQQPAETTKA